MLIAKRVFGMKGGGLVYFDNQNSFFFWNCHVNCDSILVPQWSVFVKNYSTSPFLFAQWVRNDGLCPDEVSAALLQQICTKKQD